jgi:hypothetical protein
MSAANHVFRLRTMFAGAKANVARFSCNIRLLHLQFTGKKYQNAVNKRNPVLRICFPDLRRGQKSIPVGFIRKQRLHFWKLAYCQFNSATL